MMFELVYDIQDVYKFTAKSDPAPQHSTDCELVLLLQDSQADSWQSGVSWQIAL